MRVIGYLTSGYPSIEKSIEVAGWYVEGGCDMLEISIPLENNREKPFLAEIMREAVKACPDYTAHLDAISRMAKQNPGIDMTILIYNEVVLDIGAEKFTAFCLENGIRDVNSANLTDPEAIRLFQQNGIRIAGLINFNLEEYRIEEAISATGFIYCQAFAREGQKLREGLDTIDKLIPYIRSRGIKNDIYCGGGIAKPDDAVTVKNAGADGFFLGTSIIALYDDPEKLKAEIRSFCKAVE